MGARMKLPKLGAINKVGSKCGTPAVYCGHRVEHLSCICASSTAKNSAFSRQVPLGLRNDELVMANATQRVHS
jgi:hypothetical protein